MNAIDEKFLVDLELRDTILEIADDLFNDFAPAEYDSSGEDVWKRKYICHTYPD